MFTSQKRLIQEKKNIKLKIGAETPSSKLKIINKMNKEIAILLGFMFVIYLILTFTQLFIFGIIGLSFVLSSLITIIIDEFKNK